MNLSPSEISSPASSLRGVCNTWPCGTPKSSNNASLNAEAYNAGLATRKGVAASEQVLVTASNVRSLFSYDPESGDFLKRPDSGLRFRGGNSDGYLSGGYRVMRVAKRKYFVHRLIWLYMTNVQPAGVVDHIDTDPLNNRWSNLREVPRAINPQNQRRAHRNSATGLLGVHPYGKKFRADIGISGKKHHIGYFDTAEQASEAYQARKRQVHEGCTL